MDATGGRIVPAEGTGGEHLSLELAVSPTGGRSKLLSRKQRKWHPTKMREGRANQDSPREQSHVRKKLSLSTPGFLCPPAGTAWGIL
eukprot:4831-Hanusia_phi.AAC.2